MGKEYPYNVLFAQTRRKNTSYVDTHSGRKNKSEINEIDYLQTHGEWWGQ